MVLAGGSAGKWEEMGGSIRRAYLSNGGLGRGNSYLVEMNRDESRNGERKHVRDTCSKIIRKIWGSEKKGSSVQKMLKNRDEG